MCNVLCSSETAQYLVVIINNNAFLINNAPLFRLVAFNFAVFDVALFNLALFDAALFDVLLNTFKIVLFDVPLFLYCTI